MEYVSLAVLAAVGAFIILLLRRNQLERLRETRTPSAIVVERERRLAEARRASAESNAPRAAEPVSLAAKRPPRPKKKARRAAPPAPVIPIVVLAEPEPPPAPKPPAPNVVPVVSPPTAAPAQRMLELLRDRRSIAAALLLHEVLGPPLARRQRKC